MAGAGGMNILSTAAKEEQNMPMCWRRTPPKAVIRSQRLAV